MRTGGPLFSRFSLGIDAPEGRATRPDQRGPPAGKCSSRLVFTGPANCDSLLIISLPLPRTENRYASPNERERGPSQGPPLLVPSADQRLFCSPHPPTCSL